MAIHPTNNDTVRGITAVMAQYEKDMATYLFNKYLVLEDTKETKSQIAARRHLFMQEFFPTRSEFIDADETLRKEIMDIQNATEEYARCADDYPNGRTLTGYPDSLRCKHIIYSKHRFSRCAHKVHKYINNVHFCPAHLGQENVYYAEYISQVNRLMGANNSSLSTPGQEQQQHQVQNDT